MAAACVNVHSAGIKLILPESVCKNILIPAKPLHGTNAQCRNQLRMRPFCWFCNELSHFVSFGINGTQYFIFYD
jgi:hypothetical protein